MNFSRNCGQVVTSISCAQPGIGRARKPVRQAAALERAVADDGDAALEGERQQAPFRLPIHDVVGELETKSGGRRRMTSSSSSCRRPCEVVTPV